MDDYDRWRQQCIESCVLFEGKTPDQMQCTIQDARREERRYLYPNATPGAKHLGGHAKTGW